VVLEPSLMRLVREDRAVLLAGAGMSLNAGFPSARALAEVLVDFVRRQGDWSGTGLSGSFQDIAENFSLAYGRPRLLACVQKALSAPQGIAPTPAHRMAVALFKIILTTNFDDLFEAACAEAGIPYTTATNDEGLPDSTDRTLIVKIDGSMSAPDGLVLTTDDAHRSRTDRPRLWTFLRDLVTTRSMVVVGHSLRDSNARDLLRSPNRLQGYVVAPDTGAFDEARFLAQDLRSVKCDADAFFGSLVEQLATGAKPA
jgi:hypothetical protein